MPMVILIDQCIDNQKLKAYIQHIRKNEIFFVFSQREENTLKIQKVSHSWSSKASESSSMSDDSSSCSSDHHFRFSLRGPSSASPRNLNLPARTLSAFESQLEPLRLVQKHRMRWCCCQRCGRGLGFWKGGELVFHGDGRMVREAGTGEMRRRCRTSRSIEAPPSDTIIGFQGLPCKGRGLGEKEREEGTDRPSQWSWFAGTCKNHEGIWIGFVDKKARERA